MLLLSSILDGELMGQSKPMDLVRGLKLLASDRELAVNLLSSDTFSISESSNRQTFYRVSENVEIAYSTGACVDARSSVRSDWDLDSDVWNVPRESIVHIRVELKRALPIDNIGLDLSRFKKQKAYRNREFPFIYFNREDGIALEVWRGRVYSIELLPAENQYPSLCPNEAIINNLVRRQLRFPEPRHAPACVLYNQPGNVRDVSIDQPNIEKAVFDISVKADDPENDVLTYMYRIEAGKLEGVGAKIVWNLDGEPKGTYEIKIAVDDGVGPKGLWVTRRVQVK
jgi:hypothetical protein